MDTHLRPLDCIRNLTKFSFMSMNAFISRSSSCECVIFRLTLMFDSNLLDRTSTIRLNESTFSHERSMQLWANVGSQVHGVISGRAAQCIEATFVILNTAYIIEAIIILLYLLSIQWANIVIVVVVVGGAFCIFACSLCLLNK